MHCAWKSWSMSHQTWQFNLAHNPRHLGTRPSPSEMDKKKWHKWIIKAKKKILLGIIAETHLSIFYNVAQ